MNKNYIHQDLIDDIKFFQSCAGFSTVYSLMALKTYYEHGRGMGIEEDIEWLELDIELRKIIFKFLEKNVNDRKIRIEERSA